MNGTNVGTGAIIGPQFVLTCAHNCFETATRKQFERISFTPAQLFCWPRQHYRAKAVYYHDKFTKSDLRAYGRNNDYFYLYDFAVIELDTADNLEELYGSIGYDFDWLPQKQTPIFRKDALLVGYPIKAQGIFLTRYMGDLLVDDKVIRHRMPTLGGTSGAPILELEDGEFMLRGIHSADASKLGIPHRTAMLVGQPMFEAIQQWLIPALLSYDFSSITTNRQNSRSDCRG